MTHEIWTDDERKFLRENYDRMTAAAIAKRIGRSAGAVRRKIGRMNLTGKGIPNSGSAVKLPEYHVKSKSMFVIPPKYPSYYDVKWIPGERYKITRNMQRAESKRPTDTMRYKYETDDLVFFQTKWGIPESFRKADVGVDLIIELVKRKGA